jgi:hypothetical protein
MEYISLKWSDIQEFVVPANKVAIKPMVSSCGSC